MAVVLRLARHGQTKRPYYRIVATEKTSRRDGRFIEVVGTFYPLVEPPMVKLDETKIKRWIADGAKPSGTVQSLIRKQMPGLYEAKVDHQRKKIQANRKKRKAALKSKAK